MVYTKRRAFWQNMTLQICQRHSFSLFDCAFDLASSLSLLTVLFRQIQLTCHVTRNLFVDGQQMIDSLLGHMPRIKKQQNSHGCRSKVAMKPLQHNAKATWVQLGAGLLSEISSFYHWLMRFILILSSKPNKNSKT